MSGSMIMERQYNGARRVSGPLLFVEGAGDLPYGAVVEIRMEGAERRSGQVIEVSEESAVIQVFEETIGLDLVHTSLSLKDSESRLGVSEELVGRTFDGSGRPIDGLPPIVPDAYLPQSRFPAVPKRRK